MRTVEQLTQNKFLNIKVVKDPENHVNGYQFAERLGVDSIAFICYDRKTNQFLLNHEFKPPIDQFLLTAFGGSMDKDVPTWQIVLDEVREEAGFDVAPYDIVGLGKLFVSTQMNQFCYLFLVEVDRQKQGANHPENEVEAMATPVWMTEVQVMNTLDWKAITIISKVKALGLLKG